MPVSRTNIMIASFWIVSLLCGYSDFFIPTTVYDYCYRKIVPEETKSLCTADVQSYLMKLLNKTTTANSTSLDLSQYGILTPTQNVTSVSSDSNSSGYLYDDGFAYLYPDTYGDISFLLTKKGGFCYSVLCSRYDPEYVVFIIVAILLMIMSFIYIRVCIQIYSMRRMLRGRQSGRSSRSGPAFRRNKKGLITTLCIVGTFMVCWLPFCLFVSVTIIKMVVYPKSSEAYFGVSFNVNKYLYALLILNSICDPAIYALRMREVRAGYHRLIRKCYPGYKAEPLTSDRFSGSYYMASHHSDYQLSRMRPTTDN